MHQFAPQLCVPNKVICECQVLSYNGSNVFRFVFLFRWATCFPLIAPLLSPCITVPLTLHLLCFSSSRCRLGAQFSLRTHHTFHKCIIYNIIMIKYKYIKEFTTFRKIVGPCAVNQALLRHILFEVKPSSFPRSCMKMESPSVPLSWLCPSAASFTCSGLFCYCPGPTYPTLCRKTTPMGESKVIHVNDFNGCLGVLKSTIPMCAG